MAHRHIYKEPLIGLMKGSESGGYLSRALSSSMSQNYVLAVNTRMCSALPKDYKSSGTPMGRRVGSIATYTKSPSSD